MRGEPAPSRSWRCPAALERPHAAAVVAKQHLALALPRHTCRKTDASFGSLAAMRASSIAGASGTSCTGRSPSAVAPPGPSASSAMTPSRAKRPRNGDAVCRSNVRHTPVRPVTRASLGLARAYHKHGRGRGGVSGGELWSGLRHHPPSDAHHAQALAQATALSLGEVVPAAPPAGDVSGDGSTGSHNKREREEEGATTSSQRRQRTQEAPQVRLHNFAQPAASDAAPCGLESTLRAGERNPLAK